MLSVLVVVLPLAFAGAVSPVMLTEQTMLLAGKSGRRRSLAYAGGTEVVTAALVGGIVLLGASVALPQLPRLDASLDLLIGCILLALAAIVAKWPSRRRGATAKPHDQMGVFESFAFGIFSMVTNVTSLVLAAAAAKEVAAADLAWWETVPVATVLVVTVGLPAWGPIAFALAAPRRASKILRSLVSGFHHHERVIVVTLTTGAGVWLLVRGLVRLLS